MNHMKMRFHRELVEEMGVIIKNVSPIGYIDEIRLNENGRVPLSKSHYFFAEIDGHVPEKRLETYELGFWIRTSLGSYRRGNKTQ